MKVIYEDNQIIVVEKQPNIPSQSDKTGDEDMLTMVKSYIKEKYNKPGEVYIGLVHRLDRPVGGVMVFARTSKAASRLSEQVRNKTLKKTYIATVDAKIEQEQGFLEDYLYKDERHNMSKVVNKEKKNAKLAKLDYEILNFQHEKCVLNSFSYIYISYFILFNILVNELTKISISSFVFSSLKDSLIAFVASFISLCIASNT